MALLLCLLLAPSALAQRGNIGLRVRQTATQSLTLIKPSDPLFEGMIDTYYPGLSDEPGYQRSIRPFLVLLRNDTALPAMAYAITWTVHYAGGSAGRLQAVFVNGPIMIGGAITFLLPGQVRLISPMFNVTTRQYERYHSFAQMYPANNYPLSKELTSVDVEEDGVVYRDGTFIGPDTTRVLQRYVVTRFAWRDERLAVLNLINSSPPSPFVTVAQLEQMFNKQVQWYLKANQETLLALYVRARGKTAQDLRIILRGRGLAGFEKRLRISAGRSADNTNPTALGRMYEKLSDTDPRVFGTTPPSPQGP